MLKALRSRRAQEAAFLAIGIVTPLGILAVNGSAFVMRHLSDFRLILSLSAFISAVFLNGLAAIAFLRRARLYAPDLVAEYNAWLWLGALLVVFVSAAFGAYFTYQGLTDARRLPDLTSVLTATALLVFPFVVTYAARRLEARRRSRKQR